jgi:hypothetical protein
MSREGEPLHGNLTMAEATRLPPDRSPGYIYRMATVTGDEYGWIPERQAHSPQAEVVKMMGWRRMISPNLGTNNATVTISSPQIHCAWYTIRILDHLSAYNSSLVAQSGLRHAIWCNADCQVLFVSHSNIDMDVEWRGYMMH